MTRTVFGRPLPFACAALLFLLVPGLSGATGIKEMQNRLYDSHDIELNGFVEARGGMRVDADRPERDASIGEARLQIDLNKYFKIGSMKLKADFVADGVEEEIRPELRELNYLFTPTSFVDVKAGRQVLTWGTGDLLFINDLFPKDWESFFIGRDDEYLKAPSNALKASVFTGPFSLDLVYIPEFENSKYIDGDRLSYWNSALGRVAGRDFIFADHERNRTLRDSVYAARLSRNIGSVEYAAYAYSGFWPTPEGLDPVAVKLIYPRLAVYGASVRGAVLGGIGNLEFGYYDSREDRSGEDPLVRNSEIRFLIGYERELARDFTGGLQYYLEWKQDYDQYQRALPANTPEADEYRHLVTLRLTRLLMDQNLKLSLFTYYSPSDKDCYLRPKAHYKITDQWAAEAGANIFFGSDDHTFWGQFEDNTNVYASVRWNF